MPAVDWTPFADFDAALPGVVAAVVAGGEVTAWCSNGASTPGGAALDLDSTLYVASLAKQFTAACIASLVQDRTLAVDDPVSRWLPELAQLDSVRLEHLLSHTSGLPPSNDLDDAAGFSVDSRHTTAERLGVLREVELENEPGAVHRYSNHGYVLLAEVIARATGAPLGAYAQERIFTPLGMTNTGYLDVNKPAVTPGWAMGIRRVDINFSCCGDGGLVSSVADLTRWDAWLPTAPIAGLMLGMRPTTPDGTRAHNAWGIAIRTHHGQRIESHGGAVDGYLAKCVRFPDLRTSFIALANTDAHGADDFDRRVRRVADTTLADDLRFDAPPWTDTIRPTPPR